MLIKRREECFNCHHSVRLDKQFFRCSKPHIDVQGIAEAIKHGLWIYPLRYDPRYKKTKCKHFQITFNKEEL